MTDEPIYQQFSDMCKAMESIIWAVRPKKIRELPTMEQSIWFTRIKLEIYTGVRRED